MHFNAKVRYCYLLILLTFQFENQCQQKEKERVRELSIFCYAGIDTADMFKNNFSVKELYRKN